MVYDFLLDDKKSEAAMCTVLDLVAAPDELDTVSRFFCDSVNRLSESTRVHLHFSCTGEHGRVILSGPARTVAALLQAYYSR